MSAIAEMLNLAINTLQLYALEALAAFIIWIIDVGILYPIRWLNFMLDKLLVSFITYIYSYFMKILNGTMFNETLTNEIMKNIYVFIGVIVFFRLMMIVIKYLVNPDLISDAKVGVNSLVKRCIIGLCGILFIPTIFDLALSLQSAILEDQLIQRLIIPNDLIDKVGSKIVSGGKYIGTYVLTGFISPKTGASSATKKEFDTAVSKGDLSSIKINEGGYMGDDGDYQYNYFIILSTIVLCYVLYQIFKYTLDLAVRAFKMLLYQILAPVAMIEYIINGADDGVFKSWKTAVLSTYFMLFVRVMALWFVIFVTALMSLESDDQFIQGSLLADKDYLLRAIIIVALLGFMMDLPKIVGQIFGLDLEQESSATGVFKQVGGMLKGAAVGALAVGGAAVGGAIGAGKATLGTRAEMHKNKFKRDDKGNILRDANGKKIKNGSFSSRLKTASNNNSLGSHFAKAGLGVMAATMGTNQFTKSFSDGFVGQYREQKGVDTKAKQDAAEQEAKATEAARHKEIADNQKLQRTIELAAILDQSGIKVTPQTLVARLYPEMQSTSNSSITTAANVSGIVNAAAKTMTQADIDGSGHISNGEKRQTIVRDVEEVITKQCADAGVSVSQATIHAQAEAIVDSSSFSMSGGNMTATVTADVAANMEALACQDQTITQTVNQVAGIRMNGAIEDATQVVSQKLDQQIDIQEQIQYDVHAQTNIQRNQVSMVDDIKENTERSANSLDSIDNKTGGGGTP